MHDPGYVAQLQFHRISAGCKTRYRQTDHRRTATDNLRFSGNLCSGQRPDLQQNIARNVVKYLKPGKPLVYITCSVFKAENGGIVEFIVKELGLRLEEQAVLKGYGEKADTMFVARLIRI